MNKSIKFLLLIFAIAAISTTAFAQRDSLCMTEVDVWYRADSAFHICRDIELVSESIYFPTNDKLWIYSLSDSGTISLDTVLLERFYGLLELEILDTLAFVHSNEDIVIIDISSPTQPESIYTHSSILRRDEKIFVKDTVLHITTSEDRIRRYNITNPFDIYEIPTFADYTVTRAIDYPYAFIGYSDFYNVNLEDKDTLEMNFMGTLSRYYEEDVPVAYEVRDTIIYVASTDCILRSYKTNEALDTLILLDVFDEYYPSANSHTILKDSLLFVTWDDYIKVFDVSDPSNITKIAYYHDPVNAYYDMIYINSFLVVSSYKSLRVFKYPSNDTDAITDPVADLPGAFDMAISPNPFNASCHITLPEHGDDPYQLVIYDINGQVVHRAKIASKTKSYTWNAAEIPGGIYLINITNDNFKACSKVLLVK